MQLSPVERSPKAEGQQHHPEGDAHLREDEAIRKIEGLQSHIPDNLLRRESRPRGHHRPSTQAQRCRRPSTPSGRHRRRRSAPAEGERGMRREGAARGGGDGG